jgi:CDP-diacylglycerol--glycerol-3-phosphate 3-phosphatidyltransferase
MSQINWANLVTYIRLVLIPVVVWVYFSGLPHAPIIAALLFAVASLSDLLDGYLARKLELTSDFGAFLDPVADKLLVATALIMLAVVYPSLMVPTLLIIGREILISALREWMAGKGQRSRVAVAFSGKLKTTFQMIALGGLIAASGPLPQWIFNLGYWLLWVAAALSLWSMFEYFRRAWSTLNKH